MVTPVIGLDARFFLEWEHPHGDLFFQLLAHNSYCLHPFRYVLFASTVSLKSREFILEAPNVEIFFVPKVPNEPERYFYWKCFEPALLAADLDLFLSPFYRIPVRLVLSGVKCINMIHDVSQISIPPHLLPERFRSRRKRLQVAIGFFLSSLAAFRTITVSKTSRNEILSYLRLPPEKILVFPNCINKTASLHEAEALGLPRLSSSSLDSLGGSDYLLFIGNSMPKKNLSGLLLAWQRVRFLFPDISLVVRGSIDCDLFCSIPETSLEGVVIEGSFLGRCDLDALIRKAIALVQPAFHEGFGLPVLEAMALGTPVCVSRGTVLEEVAGDSAILFDPSSPSEIAEACIKILSMSSDEYRATSMAVVKRAEAFAASKVIPGLVSEISKSFR